MGVDLTLLPMASEYEKRGAVAQDVLDIDMSENADADDSLAAHVKALPSRPVPPGFWSRVGPIGEGDHMPHQTDAHGAPLRWVAAGDLTTLASHPKAIDTPRFRGVFAYLAALPAHWPVVLYWM